MNTQQLTFREDQFVRRTIPSGGKIAYIRIEMQPGRIDFIRDYQSFGNAIHKWSIQVFETKHHTTLLGPSGATFKTLEKIRLRLLITWLVKDIICHHLNNAQSNITRKFNCLAEDFKSLLT